MCLVHYFAEVVVKFLSVTVAVKMVKDSLIFSRVRASHNFSDDGRLVRWNDFVVSDIVAVR